MTDLVERLRATRERWWLDVLTEAADEIERLRDAQERADASFYNECLRTQELAEEIERLRAERLAFATESEERQAEIDEADSLIAELLGTAQIGDIAYPAGSNRERAVKNWERRCIERATAMIAEIIGPEGCVHYRRPPDDPLVEEARRTPGYSVRLVTIAREALPKAHWGGSGYDGG